MELPTPKNADTPKERKHREQVIVIGTVVLVILTFMMLRRGGGGGSSSAGASSPDPSNDGNVTPAGGSGGDGGGYPAWLPQQVGAIPGQVQALLQGQWDRQYRQDKKMLARDTAILRREKRIEQEILAMQRHHRKPHHKIEVTRHAPRRTRHPATQHTRATAPGEIFKQVPRRTY